MQIMNDNRNFYMIRTNTPKTNAADYNAELTPFSKEDLLRMKNGDFACGGLEKLAENNAQKLNPSGSSNSIASFEVCKYSRQEFEDSLARLLLKI